MQTLLSVDIEEEDNSDYSILIDNKQVPIYSFYKRSESYGFKHIQIIVTKGSIKIPTTCTAVYGDTILKQEDYIDWFYSDKYKQNTWYRDSISFYHLFPQGPSYFVEQKPIWNFKPTIAGHLMDKNILTQKIRNMVCQ